MLRRRFLQIISSGVFLALFGLRARASVPVYEFRHGVASGDPLADGIVLWTRVSLARGESVPVRWVVASDKAMESVLASGITATNRDRDYTVKVDVRGLPSGSQLFYQFSVGNIRSPVGTTRTLPAGRVDEVRLAVMTCSNYPAGFFHAYREVAQRDDLNAVVHLGDYIYEYGHGEYATQIAGELGRIPDPPTEIISLSDYRRRHAQYKSDPDARTVGIEDARDPDSQAMHAAHPLIPIWDDHEIANEAWRGGSENHNEVEEVDEGDWLRRKSAAIRAYFEWQPIRGEANGGRTRVYRDFQFGDLLQLMMLDTRHEGRDLQPDISETDGTPGAIEAVVNGGKRRMIGRRQERWLRKRLKKSRTTWQGIGQQVLMSPLNAPDLEPIVDTEKPSTMSDEVLQTYIALSKGNPRLLLDSWDGYPWARQRLLRDIGRFGRNTVIFSGDLHTSIAGNLYLDGEDEAVAVELMPSSVTSPVLAESLPDKRPGGLRDATLAQNPHLRYLETDRRGWLCATFTHDECTAEWHLLDGITSRDYVSSIDRRLSVAAGEIGQGLYDS